MAALPSPTNSPHWQSVSDRLPWRAPAELPPSFSFHVISGHGDELSAQLNIPDGARSRLVVLVHGLGGSANSPSMVATARGLLDRGFAVVRLNLRGVDPKIRTTGFYNAGASADVAAAVADIWDGRSELGLAQVSDVALVGFSMGGNIVLKLRGEQPEWPLVAVAAISAPVRLEPVATRLASGRMRIYERVLLTNLKSLLFSSYFGQGLPEDERVYIGESRHLRDFDERFTAPANSWRDAADYYAQNSSADFLDRSEIPALVVQSRDDPMVPWASYQSVPWAELTRKGVRTQFSDNGGHLGFHDRRGRGRTYERGLHNFLLTTGT